MLPVILYDTTLRDGTQGENITLSLADKLGFQADEISELLLTLRAGLALTIPKLQYRLAEPRARFVERAGAGLVCDLATAAPGEVQGALAALKLTGGLVTVAVVDGEETLYSDRLACADCGISIPQLEPRSGEYYGGRVAAPVVKRILLPTLAALGVFLAGLWGLILPSFEQTLMDRKRELIQELTNAAWRLGSMRGMTAL